MPVRRIHLNGIQASNFGHINPPRQSVASTSKKSKLRISATSTSIHVQLAAFDALEEPSPSCYTRLLRTMVANESTRAHQFVANEM
jgi:hypothetical protein